MEEKKEITPVNLLISQHTQEKDSSIKFKERRFQQWNDNYYLYRDKIITNRLTQRQAVNVPIVRETIQTWISKIDEAPMLTFESRGKGNKSQDGEIVLNEMWAYYFDKLKLDLVDNLAKKVVGLQGRVFMKLGWAKNEFFCDLIDPFDIDIDPKVNPLDIESADWLIHKNIFRSLRQILANTNYNEKAKDELKVYLNTKVGIVQAANTLQDYQEKMQPEQYQLLYSNILLTHPLLFHYSLY